MKLTTKFIEEKPIKLTNSLRQNHDGERTREQTHKTHKLTEKSDRNKLIKLTLKKKLTFFWGALRRPIVEISNNIRYPFFSSELVSLQYLKTCEEKKRSVNIQYRNRRGETHRTQKLTSLSGAPARAIASHLAALIPSRMNPGNHPTSLGPSPSTAGRFSVLGQPRPLSRVPHVPPGVA